LHLGGVNTRGDIAETLTASGCPTRRQAVYDQPLRCIDAVDRDLILSGVPVIAPLFSPRTAQQFANQCPQRARIHLIALSSAVADPLRVLGDSMLITCDRPDADSMVSAIESITNRFCRVESGEGAQ
jgi:uroporphyrinogen-III synthase